MHWQKAHRRTNKFNKALQTPFVYKNGLSDCEKIIDKPNKKQLFRGKTIIKRLLVNRKPFSLTFTYRLMLSGEDIK